MGSAREAREYPEPTCVAYVRAHVRADQYERATEAYPRLSDEKTPAFNLARCCGKSLPYFASFGDYTNCKLKIHIISTAINSRQHRDTKSVALTRFISIFKYKMSFNRSGSIWSEQRTLATARGNIP